MAYIFSLNTTYVWTNGQPNFCYAIYALKELLKTAGWTLVRSGDGSTTSATDLITSAAVLYNYNTIGQWFIVRKPGSTLEIAFQRVLLNGYSPPQYWTDIWRIKVSPGGFGSASATATRIPTPVPDDTVTVFGGGTDASPYATSLVPAVDGRVHCAASTSAPYNFYLLAHRPGTTTVQCGIFLDHMETGTYPTEDDQPWVFGVLPNANTPWSQGSLQMNNGPASTGGTLAYLGASTTSSKFVAVQGLVHHGYSYYGVPGNLATNPFDTRDDTIPIAWARPSSYTSPQGYKGFSTMLKWMGTTRSLGSTQTVSTASDRFCIGNVTLPWDGSTPVI